MRSRRSFQHFAPLLLILLSSGCGYVHLGRLAEPATTVVGDDKLLKENVDLKLEKKMLQQELSITRAQGDALRTAIENRTADGDTSKRLVEKLNETSRELAALRANYAKLQIEKDQAVTSSAESATLKAQLSSTEEKLASSLHSYTELQGEIGRLRTEVDQARRENVALSEQVKTVTALNEQVQAALTQVNAQLFAQRDARARAEQDAETLRTQLKSVAPNASALAQQRTAAAGEARSLASEQAAEIADLRTQLENFRSKVTTLEVERSQLKQQLTGSADLANAEAKLATALRENQQLSTTKSDLENQLARLQNAPAAAQVQTLREQLRETQARATALGDENTRMKTQLASGSRVLTSGSGGSIIVNQPNRIELVEPAGTASPVTTNAPAASSVSAMLVATPPGGARTAMRADTPPANAATQPRFHVVTNGDTLSKISALYYGTPGRWGDILAANRDVLGESNNLVIGRTLRIP